MTAERKIATMLANAHARPVTLAPSRPRCLADNLIFEARMAIARVGDYVSILNRMRLKKPAISQDLRRLQANRERFEESLRARFLLNGELTVTSADGELSLGNFYLIWYEADFSLVVHSSQNAWLFDPARGSSLRYYPSELNLNFD